MDLVPEAQAPHGFATSGALRLFLAECLCEPDGEFRHHLDVDMGGVDDANLEPLLFKLLGLDVDADLLVGISDVNAVDVSDCSAVWGDPAFHVDLSTRRDAAMCWTIWRVPASVAAASTVGATLVLRAESPRWVMYTPPNDSNPMVFLAAFSCPAHHSRHVWPDRVVPELAADSA